ncbi:hypothetical protein M569_11051 [Genlisea aurea]|uniref:Uncharacterized protein n=1 Tax=Genlisea aurea TaxID=192259 RepID=S8C9Y3_9LAMI|nr:hypothetical protein M569_11051 [Genlisea aurea]
MRGFGGPLLCIGDLLSDVGDRNSDGSKISETSAEFSTASARNLPDVYQEKMAELKKALSGDDPSWPASTLKLCSALETASIMIDYSTNPGVAALAQKIDELHQIVDRRESALRHLKPTP